MTQEDKQLLLIDLCARFPYEVNVLVNSSHITDPVRKKLNTNLLFGLQKSVLTIKPYLRPMSSMTEEEREDWYRQSKVDYDCEFKPEPTLSLENCPLSVDWLNKNMFDYRGLIPMGLALEAPEEMYKV